jgi:hypothetical protein
MSERRVMDGLEVKRAAFRIHPTETYVLKEPLNGLYGERGLQLRVKINL